MNGKKEVREERYGFGFSRNALAGMGGVFRGFEEVTVLLVRNIANGSYTVLYVFLNW